MAKMNSICQKINRDGNYKGCEDFNMPEMKSNSLPGSGSLTTKPSMGEAGLKIGGSIQGKRSKGGSMSPAMLK